jgi:hypothetical protein
MSTFYARLIEIALRASADVPLLAVIADQPANQGAERKVSGSFSFPSTCLPDASEVIVLPVTENYPKDLQDLLAQKKPSRLLVVPPFLHHRFVPETIRDLYPRWNYEVITLQSALEVLPDGAKVAAIMPAGFFQGESSRSVRSQVFANYPPKLLITHAHSPPKVKSQAGYDLGVQLGLPMHGEFRLNTVVVEVHSADRCIRFFKWIDASDLGPHEEVIADLSRLLKQGGGQTKYGYVIREGLPTDAPLIHELYDPAFISKQQSIIAIGEVRQLSDLAEIRLGIPLARHPQLPAGAEGCQGARVIEGRDIGPEGVINAEELESRVNVPRELLLQKGDLCFAAISRDRIRVAEVTEDVLPATVSNTVVILRLKPGLSPEVRQTLVAYLRSAHASEQLKVRGAGSADLLRLTPHDLARLPVPILDDELSTALRDINNSIGLLRGWMTEAERAKDALFEFAQPKEDRLTLHALGRLSRQRCDAAQLVRDLRHRLRTQFPYPLAYRWRTVEASHPDLEGYLNVLGCAEVAVCYLACIALLLPGLVQGFQVKSAGQIADRMAGAKPHGTTMGEWIAIVREVRKAKEVLRAQLEAVPFGELAALDDETDQALQRLFDARNAQSHDRGPKGPEVRHRFEECRSDLELFLEGIEFITEYPLRLIERAKRDTIRKRTAYQYRELIGDHPLVPIQTAETSQAELEESLYLADRNGTLHLLRPFMNWIECPQCKRSSVFYLDRYSKKESKCFLKSMEHGHPTEVDASIVAAFQHVGLLPM